MDINLKLKKGKRIRHLVILLICYCLTVSLREMFFPRQIIKTNVCSKIIHEFKKKK